MLHQLKKPLKINLVPEAARERKQSWWRDGARHRNGWTETGPECYQGDEITANKHRLKHLPAHCHHHQPVVNYNMVLYNILTFHKDIGNHYLWDLVSYWIKLLPTMSMFCLFSFSSFLVEKNLAPVSFDIFLLWTAKQPLSEPSPPEFNKVANPAPVTSFLLFTKNREEWTKLIFLLLTSTVLEETAPS